MGDICLNGGPRRLRFHCKFLYRFMYAAFNNIMLGNILGVMIIGCLTYPRCVGCGGCGGVGGRCVGVYICVGVWVW